MKRNAIMLILFLLAVVACTTYEERVTIDGKQYIRRGTQMFGMTIHKNTEPILTSAEKSAERRDLAGDWGVWILIAGAISAGVGTALSMAIANKPLQWAANIAAIAGYGLCGAGLVLMGIAKFHHWIMWGLAGLFTFWLVRKFKDTGIDAWIMRLFNARKDLRKTANLPDRRLTSSLACRKASRCKSIRRMARFCPWSSARFVGSKCFTTRTATKM